MPRNVRTDISDVNDARRLAGLPLIEQRFRKCVECGAKFYSSGNRMCSDCNVKRREASRAGIFVED